MYILVHTNFSRTSSEAFWVCNPIADPFLFTCDDIDTNSMVVYSSGIKLISADGRFPFHLENLCSWSPYIEYKKFPFGSVEHTDWYVQSGYHEFCERFKISQKGYATTMSTLPF